MSKQKKQKILLLKKGQNSHINNKSNKPTLTSNYLIFLIKTHTYQKTSNTTEIQNNYLAQLLQSSVISLYRSQYRSFIIHHIIYHV